VSGRKSDLGDGKNWAMVSNKSLGTPWVRGPFWGIPLGSAYPILWGAFQGEIPKRIIKGREGRGGGEGKGKAEAEEAKGRRGFSGDKAASQRGKGITAGMHYEIRILGRHARNRIRAGMHEIRI